MSVQYTYATNPQFGDVAGHNLSIKVPEEGQYFKIAMDKGFQLAQFQGGKIVLLNTSEPPPFNPNAPEVAAKAADWKRRYPWMSDAQALASVENERWQGQTQGQWAQKGFDAAVSQLGLNPSQIEELPGSVLGNSSGGPDPYRDWYKDQGIQTESINDVGQFVQKTQSYTPTNYQGATSGPGYDPSKLQDYVDPSGAYEIKNGQRIDYGTEPDARTTQPTSDAQGNVTVPEGAQAPQLLDGRTGQPVGTSAGNANDPVYIANLYNLVNSGARPDLKPTLDSYDPIVVQQALQQTNGGTTQVGGAPTGTETPQQGGTGQTPPPTSGGTSQTPPPTGGGSGSSIPPEVAQLPPELQLLYTQLEEYLTELERRGQTLNPNVEITPEKLAEFYAIAEKEINPYYSTQLKLAEESLLRSLGYSQENLELFEQDLERKYGKGLRQLGESAAEQGFALSGLRQRDERELALDTQTQIDQQRRTLQFGAGSAVRDFAQAYGKPSFTSPTLGSAPRVLAGESSFGSGGTPQGLYELSPSVYDGLVGSREFERRGAVESRARDLEGAYRTQEALKQARELIL